MSTQSLRDFEHFQKTLRYFDWLGDTHASGGMDLDLCLEHRGRVLILEGKPRLGPKVLVPLGQWLTLRALSGAPGITVWLVAEDEDAKTGKGQSQYAVLEVTPQTRPATQDNGVCVFYTDYVWEQIPLAALQAKVNEWWDAGTRDP